MGYQQDEYDDTWADLVPEQPAGRDRLPVYLAVLAVSLVAICLCSATGYIVYREFLTEPTPVPEPLVPTLPGGGVVETGETPAPTVEERPPTPIVNPSPTIALEAPTAEPVATVTQPPNTAVNVEAIRLAAPLVIDGLLNDWAGAPSYISSFRVYQVASWNGTDDLTAVWRLAWDDTYLYTGVEVVDDIHVQTQSGNQIFRGDGLDMQLDTNRAGDFGPTLSPDDFQITMSPGDFASLPPSAFRFQGTQNGQILDAPGGNHVILAAVRTGNGYTLEAAIPWSDLNMTPVAGLILGLSLNANDNDTPGTAVQEVMMSHVATRTLTDPTSWGTLLLK